MDANGDECGNERATDFLVFCIFTSRNRKRSRIAVYITASEERDLHEPEQSCAGFINFRGK